MVTLRSCLSAVIMLAVACGGPPKPPPGPPPVAEPAAPLTWLVGAYAGTVPTAGPGTLDVVASQGALYAIWLGAGEARVWIVDEAAGGAPALGLWAFRGLPAAPEVATLPALSAGEQVAAFGPPDGSALWTVRRDTTGAVVLADAAAPPPFVSDPLAAVVAAPAAVLEDADRAFAAEVKARGVDGWMTWTAPGAALYRPAGLVTGHDAIRAEMTATLAGGTLSWEPVASRVTDGGDGGLGFTVGRFVFFGAGGEPAGSGSYVTVWQRQPDGAWRVVFDAGRPRG